MNVEDTPFTVLQVTSLVKNMTLMDNSSEPGGLSNTRKYLYSV